MSKKRINIFLGAAFLAVWGLIFYKLFWDVSEEEVIPTGFASDIVAPPANAAPDSIVLALNYRDPFLGTRPVQPKRRKQTTSTSVRDRERPKKTPPVEIENPAPLKWPDISCTGLIENRADGRRVALVSIDAQSHLIAKGETIAGVTLNEISSDSITLSFAGSHRTISTH